MTSLDRKYTYDRSELVSGELHKYVVMERCNVAYAAAYPNTKIYKENLDGSSRELLYNVEMPERGIFSVTNDDLGKVLYGTRPVTFYGQDSTDQDSTVSEVHHAIAPLNFSGKNFSVVQYRNPSRRFFIYPLEDNTTVEFYSNTATSNSPTTTLNLSTKGVVNNTILQGSNNTANHFISDKPIVMSSRAGLDDGGTELMDTVLMPPAANKIYTRNLGIKQQTKFNTNSRTTLGSDVYFVQEDDTLTQVSDYAEGAGGDGCQGISEELLRTSYVFPDVLKHYAIVAPNDGTIVKVYYWDNVQKKFVLYVKETMPSSSPTSPSRLVRDNTEFTTAGTVSTDIRTNTTAFLLNGIGGASPNMWRWESNKPIALFVDGGTDEGEITMMGWNKQKVVPMYGGASFNFTANNASWYGGNYSHHINPMGLNSLRMDAQLRFTLNKETTKGLIEKIQNVTAGSLTGNAQFSGVGNYFDFGAGESPTCVELDDDIYNNFRGSVIQNFQVTPLAKDVYDVNISLVNNAVSPVMNSGMGFISNNTGEKLIDPSDPAKKEFDIFFLDRQNSNSNSNVFDNFYYMNADRDGSNFNFDGAALQLKGLESYDGVYVNATRKFFFNPDQQVTLNKSYENKISALKGSFIQSLNFGKNQNFINAIELSFNNRSNKEAYAILHFLESHLGYKTFVYEFDDDFITQDRIFYCDKWSHSMNFFDSNTIKATFKEITQPVTPEF